MSTPAGKARGVVHQTLPHGHYEHERRLPSPDLRWLVEHYWYVSWDLRGLPPQQQATLPHPNVHLVIEGHEARIHGVHTARFECELSGQGRVFGIKFKPAAFHPYWQRSLATLADASCTVEDVFGDAGQVLVQHVRDAPDYVSMERLADEFMHAQVPPRDAMVEQVNAMVASVADDRSITRVEQLCERHDLSLRSLQRLFREYVGVSPKWVINRYRLHEAMAQVHEGKVVAWADLALDLGYFDQAHFIRDFRRMVGRAPGAFAREG